MLCPSLYLDEVLRSDLKPGCEQRDDVTLHMGGFVLNVKWYPQKR